MRLPIETIARLAPTAEEAERANAAWRAERDEGAFLAILDDDPTGTQSISGLRVTVRTDADALTRLAERGEPFFVLTNSRAYTPEETLPMHRALAAALREASLRTGREARVISRSDSTLRGHYPLETDALMAGLDGYAGALLCPFFLEGGRFTIGGAHYVREGDWLVNARDTEFARDASFGYTADTMVGYVSEKSGGAISPGEVAYVSLSELRAGRAKAALLKGARAAVCDAVSPEDARALVTAWRAAWREGVRYLPRTAASFAQAACGQMGGKPADLQKRGAGVFLIGSHTAKTTRQLEALRALSLPETEFDVNGDFEAESARCRRFVRERLAAGESCAVYTSRTVRATGDGLRFSRALASALALVVSSLDPAPAFVVAKGGITSCEVGVRGLGVSEAVVDGQAIPGVPVWRLPETHPYGAIPYVIFPGNVGGDDALLDVARQLT